RRRNMPRKSGQPSKNGTSKSGQIREILTGNPNTPSKEIIQTLAQRGVKVQPSLVYMVKSQMKRRKRKLARQRATEAGARAGMAGPVELVVRVKRLAGEAGGLKNLKQLVDVMAE